MKSPEQPKVSKQEKGGGTFEGIKLLLCENPLPPLEEAIAAAQSELPPEATTTPNRIRRPCVN